MSNLIITQAAKLGESFGMEGDGHELLQILKSTAFKGQVTDAQMAALMVVANQYQLNPFTRELFAFPDKNNGIVPVVGVDGWSRIINSHPQFDGIDFEQDSESCTCIIYRKDRSHPIKVTEWMAECKRGTGPWQSHPRRMLRHKAMIQCARLAFGYGGIYDQDEAERIVESGVKHMGAADVVAPPPEAPKFYDPTEFDKNFPVWSKAIAAGKKTASEVIKTVETKALLTEEQKAKVLSVKKAPAADDVQDVQPKEPPADEVPAVSYAEVAGKLRGAQDMDSLDDAASLIGAVSNPEHRAELAGIFDECAAALSGE